MTPAQDKLTIYGSRALVRRYNGMMSRTPAMAARIAANAGREKAIKLSRCAGAWAESLRREWGGSSGAADDDPKIGFWEALESQLAEAARETN